MRITSEHRNAKGQFQPGNPGGRGNPHNCQVAVLRRKLDVADSEEEFQAIAQELLQLAMAGNVPAANMLLTAVFGDPQSSLDELACMQSEESAPATPTADCFNGEPSNPHEPATRFNGVPSVPCIQGGPADISAERLAKFDPEGIEAISRWLSAAIPPVQASGQPLDPEGIAASAVASVFNSPRERETGFNGDLPEPRAMCGSDSSTKFNGALHPKWPTTALTVSRPRPREPGAQSMMI